MATDRYNLPSSGAATMWAHITRKDTLGRTPTSMEPGSFLPPTGAQDKTATTMRILLHDTQMNFEKFSGNVERLIEDVQKVEQGMKTTSSLFEKEHDKLMGDIIDLVNRAQTKIQATIGAPAQASVVDALINNVDRRLESLDQRLDAMHAFNQTHSQALQVQMQTIQALQTQQNTIISAVAPLLPLLQTLTSYPHPSRVSAVFSSPRSSNRHPGSPGPLRVPSMRTHVENLEKHPPYGKKRTRSSSDSHPSSSPSASISRKKNRITSSPFMSDRSDENTTEKASSKSLGGHISNSSPGLQPTTRGAPFILQTPRRPLQELFRSPHLTITPLAQQRQQNGTSSWTVQPPSSSKQGISNLHMEKIVRRMSLQRSVGPPSNTGPVPSIALAPEQPQQQGLDAVATNEKSPPSLPQSQVLMPPPPRISMRQSLQAASTATPRQSVRGYTLQGSASRTHSIRPNELTHFKEGKRFIPLIDNDSTDEDED